MVKREKSDSGLMKGFIREDEALKKAQELAEIGEEKLHEPKEKPEVKEDKKPEPKKEDKPKEEDSPKGPTVEMQGVSGKVITGTVRKVTRKKKADTEAEAKPAEEKPAAAASEEAEPRTIVKESVKVKAMQPEPSEVGKEMPEGERLSTAKPRKVEVKVDEGPKGRAAEIIAEKGKIVPQQELKEKKAAKKAAPKQEAPAKAKQAEAESKPAPQAEPEKAPEKPAAKQEKKPAAKKDGSRDLPTSPRPKPGGLVEPGEAEGPPKGRVLVDQGVRRSSYQGPVIRAQEGSYLGPDADKPKFEKRRYDPNRGKRGRGKGRRFTQDKDKDADEKPRFQQRRRQRRPGAVEVPPQEAQKSDNRRQFEQKRGGDRRRTEDDWKRHHEQKERSFEQELLRESRRRRRQKKAERRGQRAVLTHVKLPEALTVKELAELLKKTSAEVITKLMQFGVMATMNQEIDFDTAEVIANEFGIEAEMVKEVTEEDILFDDTEDEEEDLELRPPVVVVMGHVDHGKTSILDYIREAHVTKGEAGGITQHIGAYTVDLDDRKITFIDTPGHEAFTAMRARGAQVTDIAILVVAADDGVMPQTIEAINHARQAGTEIIVAINKIDKPTANIDRVKQELAAQNILSPDWGGTTEMVPVSAKTGEGIEDLLEMILLTSDVMELKANPDRQAKGTVIESYLDRGRGPVATVLVQRGTLRQGDMVVVGSNFGNIRAMTNDRGQQIESAGPSTPVEILGLSDVPEGGEIFYQVEDERAARSLAERRAEEEREEHLSKTNQLSLDNLFAKLAEGEIEELNIIVKADVQGSVEAVKQSLEKLSTDEVRLTVIHGSVGAITESDVRLAEVSDAIIIGFNVRPPASVKKIAEDEGVDIRLYQVIYDAIEDMEKAMTGLLAPEEKEFVLGHAEVRETYKVSGVGMIAGCYVTDGVVQRNARVRVLRDNIILHDGQLGSLRRFKDDVREVREGYECGITIDKFNDIREGDVFEMYEIREIAREEL